MKLGLIKAKTPACVDCGGETVRQVRFLDGKWLTFYVCVECPSEVAAKDLRLRLNRRVMCGIRYRMRSHELRDLFRTECHRAMRQSGFDLDVAKFCMGHGGQIDPNKYDKIMHDVPATLIEYRKALPFLNVLSEDPRKIERSEVESQLEASEAKVDVLSKEVADLRRKMKVLDDSELLEALKEIKRKKE